MNLASYIDHTLLKPTMTAKENERLCEEAIRYEFAAVCVPPPMVVQAKALTKNSAVKTATVIGFPFGYSAAAAKLAEVSDAIKNGADELDVVINLIFLKAGNRKGLEQEMKPITELAHQQGRIVKVIIESGILQDDEIIFCCKLYSSLGADFLKTSTGYAEQGASLAAVKLMRANLPSPVKIKASGGIRTYDFAASLIAAGADRLGCSASVAIVSGQPSDKKNAY